MILKMNPTNICAALSSKHGSLKHCRMLRRSARSVKNAWGGDKESPTWGTGRAELDGSAELGGSPTKNLSYAVKL